MKRLKAFLSCGIAAVCMAAMLALMSGCSSQESYTPPEKSPTLSSPTIGKDGVLRVGVNTQNQPLAGQSTTSSKIVGIDVDIAAALADSFGLKLELVDVGTDFATALTEGKVDIVMGVDKSDSDTSFWKSEIYLPTAVALFSAEGNATVPTNDMKPTIAAQVASKSAWAVTNEFDQAVFSATSDLPSAFSSLAAGEVQYVASDAVIGTYAAHIADNAVQIVALMQQPSGYCVGVLDSNTDLKQAISDTLASLTGNGVISVIEKKWLGTTLDLASVALTDGATAASTTTTTPEPEAQPEGEEAPAEGEGEGGEAADAA
ncbi:ABC transporter substrate-binding protein [Eggerthella sp. YY7918]|uniref:substrate-binding periplasmic protein n=1 Tax=Eggerthella sp. (strain YY7918) TaxID=502558 RepID=UPI0002171442|nr:transporter substrate-binding domain-containing protein [Eggerthella sp. YY7918]BAK44313.1 hypothetical protein EGYY_11400 [Eggerthella sp. YY7918]